ncbi:hypothetical protein ACLUYJ_18805, partial [Acinetobacter baumannii]|uniref:hypothetical protein n=1 Tax=Acinetobacter baumannii TaxID=470 RepID=UPI0039955B21
MPSISVILFYILAILGFCSAVGGLLSLSMFLIIIGIGLTCAAFLLKKDCLLYTSPSPRDRTRHL